MHTLPQTFMFQLSYNLKVTRFYSFFWVAEHFFESGVECAYGAPQL